MNHSMFCFQCQEAFENTGCNKFGKCGKSSEVSNLQDQLIAELKKLALALSDKYSVTREYSRFICRAISATLTNTNFNPDRIYSLIDECRRYQKTLDSSDAFPSPNPSIVSETKDVSLRETLMYTLKGICSYAFQALALGYEDNAIYDFVIKVLAICAKPEQSQERLAMLIMESGRISMIAMALLDEANTENFGNPEITKVTQNVGNKSGILMSGHDLKDLEELLIETKDAGVDVYTHGEMLAAHAYPELKKYPHFKGHYGNSWIEQEKDFENFRGAIIVNSNCLTPVSHAYRDRIFTTGMAGYQGIPHIPHRHIGFKKDFSAVIKLAQTLPPPLPLEKPWSVSCGFANRQSCAVVPQVVNLLKKGAIRRFVVIAGCDGRSSSREYYTSLASALPKDTVILTAGCMKYRLPQLNLGEINGLPRLLDAGQCNDVYSIIRFILRLQEAMGYFSSRQLPVSIVLGWYEQKALSILFAFLHLGFKNIRLGPSFPAFFSKSIMDALDNDYGVKKIDIPELDAKAIMEGR